MVRALVGNALAQTLQNLESVTAGVITVFVASLQLVFIVLDMLPRNWLNCYIYMKIIVWFSTDAKVAKSNSCFVSTRSCFKFKFLCLMKILKTCKQRMYKEARQVAKDAVRSIRTVASFCGEENL